MTFQPARRNPPSVQAVPVITYNVRAADAAFAAHSTLIGVEASRPDLALNPYWQALRDSAFARFRAAFEVA